MLWRVTDEDSNSKPKTRKASKRMDPTTKAFQEAFENAQRSNLQNMAFTKGGNLHANFCCVTFAVSEESDRFKKAFEDAEFRKLFSEYMDELQNPEHRSETEAYISQLEGENKVPAGKQLVRPAPAFVVKTKMSSDPKPKEGEPSKLFINIVSSPMITAPSKVESKEVWIVCSCF